MKIALWFLALAIVLGALAATALRAEGDAALKQKFCWCYKVDTWTCRPHLVSRTCYEVPDCRDPLPVGSGELRCWQRQQSTGLP